MPRKLSEFGRPVGQQRGRAFMAAVGVAGLLLAALTFYIGYEAAYSVPGRGYYDIKAEFDDANNLANHYEVRLGGVRAGQVLHPRVEDGKAVVDLRLDDEFGPLPVDSEMQVRLRSAVGVRYLEIIPGESAQTIPEGGTLASTQVRESVALDEVLGTFDADTRGRTRDLLQALGNGLHERGGDLNEVVGDAPDLLESLASVSDAITARPGEQMRGFIRNGAATAEAFDDAREDIVAGLEPEESALEVFTDEREGVQETLESAGPALGSLQRTLPAVDRFVGEVRGLGVQGRGALEAAPPALAATTRMMRNAETPLREIDDTLQLAKDATGPVLRLLDKVDPVLPTIKGFTDGAMPQLRQIGPRSCSVSDMIRSWAHYLGIGGQETNFIRFHLLAVRPEQPAGQQAKGTKATDSLYDRFVNRDPYLGPCTNNMSEGSLGKQAPVTARILDAGRRPFSKSNPPWETDPFIESSPAQAIGGK